MRKSRRSSPTFRGSKLLTRNHNCSACGHRHDDEHLCIPIVLEKYSDIASRIAYAIAKTYRYSNEDCRDVVGDVLLGLLQIPPQYRNLGGVKFWSRARAINSITARLPFGTSGTIHERDKHSDWYGGVFVPYASREEASNDGVTLKPGEFISESQCVPPSEVFASGQSDGGGWDLMHDFESVRKYLPQLTSEQRAVIELSFGINGKEFSNRQIARKLGRDARWVAQRLEKGLAKLRELMSCKSSDTVDESSCSLELEETI